jgi:predicted RNase H-like HicB family nuclease
MITTSSPGDQYGWSRPINKYRLEVRLTADPESGFVVVAARLPGCVSQGESEEEAMANIQEAAEGCIRSYLDAGRKIPLVEARPAGDDELVRWIFVQA